MSTYMRVLCYLWNYHGDTLKMEGCFACLTLFTPGSGSAWIDSVQALLLYLDDVLVGPRLARKAFQSSLILAVYSRYLTIAWVTFLMHFLATVGHKVSNYWKYGILLAAEEVVRAGVLSYAPGSESEHTFHLSHFHRLVSFCRFVLGCWGGLFALVLFLLFTDQSVRSSYQPMTSLAYIHDCHSCYDERSIDQKKTVCLPVRLPSLVVSLSLLCRRTGPSQSDPK